MTKIEMFEAIKSVVPADRADMIEFLDKEIKMVIRKNSYVSDKPTAKQVENEGYKCDILATLAKSSDPMTVTEIWDNTESLVRNDAMTGQRVTALLTQLKNSGKVTSTYIKRKAYFALAGEDEEVGE